MERNYDLAANYIKSRVNFEPEIGLILGSGLGGISKSVKSAVVLPYADIPGFAVSTAPGHDGKLIAGKLCGKNVLCMKGRLHFYEGHASGEIIFPVRVMRLLGVKTLIITNSAGGINNDFEVGDIMQITDHINFTGTNPLIGANDGRFGERFFDMTHAYDDEYFALAREVAEECGISLKSGVYLGCSGPSFETPAEIIAFRALGADAVGMSTVFEVIAASQMKMRVMGFSLISNLAAGMTGEALSGGEVIEAGKESGGRLQTLIERIIEKI